MKSKAGAALFALIFALGFGAGGAFGIGSLYHQLNGWWQARHWQAVPATVLSAELKTSQGDSTTYQATATYRYVVEGRTYEGSRIGLSGGSDNVGTWQQQQYAHLEDARRDGRAIKAWVDPKKPDRSIINRDLRLAMIAFTVPFATIFPAISIGALWVLIKVLRTPAQGGFPPATPAPNEREIRSDARASAWGRWAFALFWGLIAFPLAFVMAPELYGRSWLGLVVMIFPFVGVLLLYSAAAQTIRLLRRGEITIRLSPAQPRLGEPLTVHATFAHKPSAGEHVFTLLCEEVDTRNDSIRYRTLWKQECPTHPGGTYATTTFSPPGNLPPSEASAGVYHRWRVLLGFPQGKDQRAFDVTMSPGQRDSTVGEHLNLDAPGSPKLSRSMKSPVNSVDWARSANSTDSARSAANPATIGVEGLPNAAQAARAVRIAKHAIIGVATLVILAITWRVVGGLLPGRDGSVARPAPPQQVERADLLSEPDRALFRAVEQQGSAREVAAALEKGANVNAVNGWGATPLIVAARASSAEIVEALIRAGSGINFSIQQDNEYRGRTPLMSAARSGEGENLRLLLEAGADAGAFESHGWTAAHYAAHQGNIEGLRALREHGVNLDVLSPVGRGETPLMVAARKGELEAIRELIRLGANPRTVDRHGENAYGLAKYFKQPDAMKLLATYE